VGKKCATSGLICVKRLMATGKAARNPAKMGGENKNEQLFAAT